MLSHKVELQPHSTCIRIEAQFITQGNCKEVMIIVYFSGPLLEIGEEPREWSINDSGGSFVVFTSKRI